MTGPKQFYRSPGTPCHRLEQADMLEVQKTSAQLLQVKIRASQVTNKFLKENLTKSSSSGLLKYDIRVTVVRRAVVEIITPDSEVVSSYPAKYWAFLLLSFSFRH